MTNFIQFTTEGEEDFDNLFLPTLDFQTQVQPDGRILYKFYSKPMANNIAIQFGTGLPKNTIFSALRQELIRRMLNCSEELLWDERLGIVDEFVQLLINSGHKYAFVKSITLQAITKYKYMIERSRLSCDDKKYMPLYRARNFDHVKRKVSKMVEVMTWYKGIENYDRFRNGWKKRMRNMDGKKLERKKDKPTRNKKVFHRVEGGRDSEKKDIVCAMFVPPSLNSKLLYEVEEAEREIDDKMDWSVKLIEQSGFPLGMSFIPKFPLKDGCEKGLNCILCGNTSIKCSKKGVIYKATCTWCTPNNQSQSEHVLMSNENLSLQECGNGNEPAAMEGEVQTVDVTCIKKVSEDGEMKLPVGMDHMNKALEGGRGLRAVVMDEMNKAPIRGGVE